MKKLSEQKLKFSTKKNILKVDWLFGRWNVYGPIKNNLGRFLKWASARLIGWFLDGAIESASFLKTNIRRKLIRLSSCDEVTIDNYISSLEKLIAPSTATTSQKTKVKPQKIQVSGNFLRIDNQDFDLSNEALDNLRKTIAESILFLDRQSRDF